MLFADFHFQTWHNACHRPIKLCLLRSLSLSVVLFFLMLGVIRGVANLVMLMHAIVDKLFPIMKMHKRIAFQLFFHRGGTLI